MKSGNQLWQKTIQRILKEYEDAHVDMNCKGKFEFKEIHNTRFSVGALGPIQAAVLPMIVCESCESAYTFPGFEELVSQVIAKRLILSPEILTKKQIRFLRQHFNLSQESLAKKIGIPDKYTLSKYESESSIRHMEANTQLRMKICYAKMLDIKEAAKIYELVEIDENKIADIDSSCFEEANIQRKACR